MNEINKNREKRWVNPGTMGQLRIRANQSPFIEYSRNITDRSVYKSSSSESYDSSSSSEDSASITKTETTNTLVEHPYDIGFGFYFIKILKEFIFEKVTKCAKV